MKKRILAVVLAVFTILGLVPMAVMTGAETITKFIDPVDPSLGGSDVLKLIEQAAPEVPDGTLTPYGTGSLIKLIEKNELFISSNILKGIYFNNKGGDHPNLSVMRRDLDELNSLRFAKAVAFDPKGGGRRDYIAVLGIKEMPQGSGDNCTAALYIFKADGSSKPDELTFDSVNLDWAWTNLEAADANNYFSITAGDYDGDGKDSLVIYTGHIDVFSSSSSNLASGLYEIKYAGMKSLSDTWSSERIQTNRKGSEYLNKEYVNYCSSHFMDGMQISSNPGDRLGVSLETGDINGDGIDDLVVLSSTSNLSDKYKAAYRACIPMLAVGFGRKGASNVGDLSIKNTNEIYSGSHTIYIPAAPDVSIGDIDGNGTNEIVIAGFHGMLNKNGRTISFFSDSDSDAIQAHIFTLNDLNGELIRMGGKELTSHAGEISAISYDKSLRRNDSSWQQCSVECVDFDGLRTKTHIFINGYIYQAKYDSKTRLYTLERSQGSDSLDVPKKDQSESNFGFNFHVGKCNGEDVNEVFIRSIAAGNMRRRNDGAENLEMIVGFKKAGKAEYLYKRIAIIKNANGDWVMEKGDYMLGASGGNESSKVFLTDVDVYNSKVPSDTLTVRYNTTLSAYTDPNVVAFLQAAPYFNEFGAGNSSTSYSYSESYTRSTSSGTEKSFGIGITAGFETPAVKTEMEAMVSTAISEEFTESRTTEFTTTFEANNKNQVIVRRTLMYIYCYDVLTGINIWTGNPKYETASFVVSVPQYPVLTSLSMEQYDAFAAAYNAKYGKGVDGSASYYLDIISKNNGALMNKYFLNNEGNPFAYASDVSKYRGGFSMTNSGNWMGLSHSGGVSTLAYSTSVGTERSKTVSDSASINLAVTVGSSFAGFGASVGITTSLSSLKSKGISTAQVTTTATSGTVQNLSDDATEYNFDWQLIGWKTDASDGLFNGVPFVGYAVRNVSAPPPCVTDLHVEYDGTPGRAYLCWNMPQILTGRIAVHNFDVYRVDGGKRQLLGNINCDETGYAMFEVTSGSPSASYVVVAKNAQTGQCSIDSNEVLVIFATTKDQVKKLIEDAYTDLTGSINDLKTALESGQAEAIKKAIEDLTEAYKAADDLLKSELTEADAALEEKLNAADEALKNAADTVQANLDKAVADLTKLINDGDKANSDALAKAINDLTEAYKAADALLGSELTGKLTALEEKLTKADEALKNSIDTVQANLDKAVGDLTKLINNGDKANSDALAKAINELTAAYKAADALLGSELAGKLTALEEKLTKADEALTAAIDEVRNNLDRATSDLTKAIADGDKAGAEKLGEAVATLTKTYQIAADLMKSDIKSLTDRLAALEEAMKKADEALGKNINDVKSELEREIEELRNDLKSLRESFDAKERENDEKLAALGAVNDAQQSKLGKLKAVAVTGLCISVISFMGDIALLVLFLRQKKTGL